MSECPVCKRDGLRSRPQLMEETEQEGPILRINDDDGYHFHDRTVSIKVFQCTNGHEWIESTTSGCRHCETLDNTQVIACENESQQPQH